MECPHKYRPAKIQAKGAHFERYLDLKRPPVIRHGSYSPWVTDSLPAWRLFWAKTDRDARGTSSYDPAWTRPLWAHLLDVAHTALLLWERVVPDALRADAAATLGLSEQEAGRWLALQIGLA